MWITFSSWLCNVGGKILFYYFLALQWQILACHNFAIFVPRDLYFVCSFIAFHLSQSHVLRLYPLSPFRCDFGFRHSNINAQFSSKINKCYYTYYVYLLFLLRHVISENRFDTAYIIAIYTSKNTN